MIPCRRADCLEWFDPTDGSDYCEKHRRKPIKRRQTRAYDATAEQVRGIGIVTTRRVLVHRPKSVRRTTPANRFSEWSYSDMRDSAELDRRKRTIPRDTSGKTVAQARAERRDSTMRLLGLAGTIRMAEQD